MLSLHTSRFHGEALNKGDMLQPSTTIQVSQSLEESGNCMEHPLMLEAPKQSSYAQEMRVLYEINYQDRSLVGLFALQHYGTHNVGFLFAAILIAWVICIRGIAITTYSNGILMFYVLCHHTIFMTSSRKLEKMDGVPQEALSSALQVDFNETPEQFFIVDSNLFVLVRLKNIL